MGIGKGMREREREREEKKEAKEKRWMDGWDEMNTIVEEEKANIKAKREPELPRSLPRSAAGSI